MLLRRWPRVVGSAEASGYSQGSTRCGCPTEIGGWLRSTVTVHGRRTYRTWETGHIGHRRRAHRAGNDLMCRRWLGPSEPAAHLRLQLERTESELSHVRAASPPIRTEPRIAWVVEGGDGGCGRADQPSSLRSVVVLPRPLRPGEPYTSPWRTVRFTGLGMLLPSQLVPLTKAPIGG